MKKRLWTIFISAFILVLLPINKSYTSEPTIEYLDIKLTRPLTQTNMINMESNSGFVLYDRNDVDNILSIIDEIRIIAIPNENGDIDLINSESKVLFTLPKDGSILISSSELENPRIKIEKDSYRDYIRLVNNNNLIIVINHVSLENYLYGVVPREMPSTFHPEALKAQAVASRSFAISNSNKHIADGYNLCDTTHCQVYSGFDGEKPSTNLAVDETKNILVYYEGKVIEAIYHSTSSGFTEDSINVWSTSLPYLKSVEDKFSTESPYSHWSLRVELNDFNSKLIPYGINVGELIAIEVIDTTLTGKVNKVRVIGTSGEEIITGTKFREIIGTTTLKSAWFNIKKENNNVWNSQVYVIDGNTNKPKAVDLNKSYIMDGKNKKTIVTRGTINRAIGKDRIEGLKTYIPNSNSEILIEGRGFGHGVGMSQYGAKKMGELGYSFEEILKYYYTDIYLVY